MNILMSLSGKASLVAATLCLALLASIIAAAPAHAAGGILNATVNSVQRVAATGNLYLDVTATATDYLGPDSPCAGHYYSCTLNLRVKTTTGTPTTVASESLSVPMDYSARPSASHRFQVSFDYARVESISLELTYYAGGSTATDEIPVTDPYPTAEVSASLTSISRSDSSGALSMRVHMTASNYTLADGVCPRGQSCLAYLETTTKSGSAAVYASADIPTQSFPAGLDLSFTDSESNPSAQITSWRVFIKSYYSSDTQALTTPAMPVTDPYPSPSVSADLISIERAETTSGLTMKVHVTAAYYSMPDSVCPGTSGCIAYLEVKPSGGSAYVAAQADLPRNGYPANVDLTMKDGETNPSSRIVSWRVFVKSYYSNDTTSLTTPNHPVSDPYPTPTVSARLVSIDRKLETGGLTLKVHVTASNYDLPDSVCAGATYGCLAYLEVTTKSGSTMVAAQKDLPQHTFPAEVDLDLTDSKTNPSAQVVSWRVFIKQYYSQDTTALSTDAHAVTDPYPKPSLYATLDNLDRISATGALNMQVHLTAANYSLPDGVCAGATYGCIAYLEVTPKDGNPYVAAQAELPLNDYPASVYLTSNDSATNVQRQLVAWRVYVMPRYGSDTHALTTTGGPLDDPYVGPTVDLALDSVQPTEDGQIRIQATVSARRQLAPDGPCNNYYSCSANIELTNANGSYVYASSLIEDQTKPATLAFDFKVPDDGFTKIRAYVVGYANNNSALMTSESATFSKNISGGHDLDRVERLLLRALINSPDYCVELFQVGSHSTDTSLSDQLIACEEARQAGKTIKAFLRAYLTIANAVDITNMLISAGLAHQEDPSLGESNRLADIASNEPNPDPEHCVRTGLSGWSCSWPDGHTEEHTYTDAPPPQDSTWTDNQTAGRDAPPAPSSSAGSSVETPTDEPTPTPGPNPTPETDYVPSAAQMKKVAVETCAAEIARAKSSLNPNDCKTMNIFATAQNNPQTTKHDADAIKAHKEWFLQSYVTRAEKEANGGPKQSKWMDPYRDYYDCNATNGVKACDEFPYFTTEAGADVTPDIAGNPITSSLRLIDWSDNSGQGSRYKVFKDKCNMDAYDRGTPQRQFVVAPIMLTGSKTVGFCDPAQEK